ncbi:MAG: hypothetical protein SV487_08665, partial [Thermodesulfobacteriota bacterium]|nr:hypothetical protein [Thermodesulfobacteriota bacterium]
LLFVNHMFGCTKLVRRDIENLKGGEGKIVEIVLLNGDVIKFGESGGRYTPSKGAVAGITSNGLYKVIASDEILYVKFRGVDVGKSLIAIAVTGLVVGALVVTFIAAHTPKIFKN